MEDKKNFLIPQHRKLSDEESQMILNKYNLVSKGKLPKIKIGDAGLEGLEEVTVGDIIEILRTSFAGETKYYRVVVE